MQDKQDCVNWKSMICTIIFLLERPIYKVYSINYGNKGLLSSLESC
jgi:hypothetical protein